MLEDIFIGDVSRVPAIVVSAFVLYLAIIAFIRVSGKRATSQMNNFDWIVTVAIGSLTASGIVVDTVSILHVLLAIGLLLLFQYGITWAVVRNDRVADWVKPAPRLLLYNGELRHDALIDERISEREILAAVRNFGKANLSEVGAVVLETDGTFNVLSIDSMSKRSSTILKDVKGARPSNC